MDSKMIDRINTLHHKAQSVGLTEEEKIEQAKLRKEYIATIKMNLRNQLDNIDIKEGFSRSKATPGMIIRASVQSTVSPSVGSGIPKYPGASWEKSVRR